MYMIKIGAVYFNARGGFCGTLGRRTQATMFTLSDATERAARMGAVVVSA